MFSSTHLGDVLETTCDHCHSRFRITESQLRQAFGQARCSECGKTFNALLALRTFDGELPPDYQHETTDEEILTRRELSLHEAMYGTERRRWFSSQGWTRTSRKSASSSRRRYRPSCGPATGRPSTGSSPPRG